MTNKLASAPPRSPWLRLTCCRSGGWAAPGARCPFRGRWPFCAWWASPSGTTSGRGRAWERDLSSSCMRFFCLISCWKHHLDCFNGGLCALDFFKVVLQILHSVRVSCTTLTSTTSGNSSQNTLSLMLNARLWEASCLFCEKTPNVTEVSMHYIFSTKTQNKKVMIPKSARSLISL